MAGQRLRLRLSLFLRQQVRVQLWLRVRLSLFPRQRVWVRVRVRLRPGLQLRLGLRLRLRLRLGLRQGVAVLAGALQDLVSAHLHVWCADVEPFLTCCLPCTGAVHWHC